MPAPIAFRHRVAYAAFRLTAAVVDALPAPAVARVCGGLARAVDALPRRWTRGDVARRNLRIAFPEFTEAEADATVRGMWAHLLRLVAEMIAVPRKLRRENQADVLSFVNRDETVRAVNSGRPLVMLGGHYGNWEVASAAFGAMGVPVSVVARDLDNPLLHDWFASRRRASGGRLISKKGGGGAVTEVLEAGGAVGLLADQSAGSNGVFVPFFGKDASTFKSIALLAMEYDALVLVGYARRLPDDFAADRWVRFEVGTEAVLDPRDFTAATALKDLTAAYTAALERAVRKSPEQYFWVHRRWKGEPRVRRKRARRVERPTAELRKAA